jgi:hypothetical protein
MKDSTRFKLLALLAGVVLVGGSSLFTTTARWYARQAVAWHELPPPVRDSLLGHVGTAVVVEIERGPSAGSQPTYRIRVSAPDTPTQRLWLAEDGTQWPPTDSRPANSDSLPPSRD